MTGGLRFGVLVLLAAFATGSCSNGELTRFDGDVSDFQAEILEDSRVEFSEYERAILAAMSCVEGYGFETRGPIASQGGRSLGFDAVVDDAQDTYAEVLERCEQEYLFPLVDVYNAGIAPSKSQIQKGDEIVIACVREHGYDVADSLAAYEAMISNLDTLGVCFDERDAFLYP